MLSSFDKSIIRIIQEDLPLVPQPYQVIASELGVTEEELLIKIQELCKDGIVRRFGATLNHRSVGFKGNAMVAWFVNEDRIKEVSKIMVSFSEVSHCYQRPVYPSWPYNIFTMIHCETRQKCEEIVENISNTINVNDYKILFSTRELKKSSMKYFIEDDN